jgi:AcrR family transcriptional regulator
VVATARRLFAQKGYHATSIRDIITEAGVSRGGLYHHLPTKQALLEEILSSILPAFLAAAQAALLPASDSCAARLERLIRAHIRVSLERAEEVRISLDLSVLAPEEFARDRAGGTARNSEYASLFENLIAEGVAGGEFRTGLDPKVTAFHILGVVSWVRRWYNPAGPLSLGQIADSCVDFVLRAVLAQPGEQP